MTTPLDQASIERIKTQQARHRFFEIMNRHIRAKDVGLTDLDLVSVVVKRFDRERRAPIVDISE